MSVLQLLLSVTDMKEVADYRETVLEVLDLLSHSSPACQEAIAQFRCSVPLPSLTRAIAPSLPPITVTQQLSSGLWDACGQGSTGANTGN